MAYLDNTRPNMYTPVSLTLCLTPSECELLMPIIKAALRRQEKKFWKYSDIQASGEATTRQQTEYFKAEENTSYLRAIKILSEQLIESERK